MSSLFVFRTERTPPDRAGKRSAHRVIAWCAVAMILSVPCYAQRLEPKRIEKLETEVIPAFRGGDHLAVLKALSPMMGGMDDATLAAINDLLAARNVPPVGELITAARIRTIQLGQERQLPKAKWRESLLSLGAISRHADHMIDRKQAHPAVNDPSYAPATFLAYEHLFTELHAIDLQLEETKKLVDHAVDLAKQNARTNRKKLAPEQIRVLDRDYAGLGQELSGHHRHTQHRLLELRLNRLSEAEYVLRLSENKAERFMAVCALNQDASELTNTLGSNPAPEWLDASWANADRKTEIQQTIQRAAEHAGPALMRKGQLLADGLTWWLRGRYGRSEVGIGLIKSAQAKRDPQANLRLWMPDAMPIPTAPGDTYRSTIPQFDRRHHYTWNWETRDIVVTSSSGGVAGSATETRVNSEEEFAGFL